MDCVWIGFATGRDRVGYEIEAMQKSSVLSKLDLAFSRDQEEKIYVQDRMREQGTELFALLEQGGYFFVCGDAYRMATLRCSFAACFQRPVKITMSDTPVRFTMP
jgi:hypothetical protein